MTHYFVNFITYTFAVCGLLLLALYVYKRTTAVIQGGKSADFLRIEHRLDLSARKSLYVVKAGAERFLIATDTDKTTFLSKLNDNQKECVNEISENKEDVSAFANILNFEKSTAKNDGVAQREEGVKNFKLDERQMPVLKSLMKKMGGRS